jgi:hypothetical protein
MIQKEIPWDEMVEKNKHKLKFALSLHPKKLRTILDCLFGNL